MASLPGTWRLFYSWGCSTSYPTSTLTLNANGTWSNSHGESGKWKQVEGMFLQNFNGLATVYGGLISGNVMCGNMTNFTSTGCWYAVKSGVTSAAAAKAKGLSPAGGSGGSSKGASKKGSKKR